MGLCHPHVSNPRYRITPVPPDSLPDPKQVPGFRPTPVSSRTFGPWGRTRSVGEPRPKVDGPDSGYGTANPSPLAPVSLPLPHFLCPDDHRGFLPNPVRIDLRVLSGRSLALALRDGPSGRGRSPGRCDPGGEVGRETRNGRCPQGTSLRVGSEPGWTDRQEGTVEQTDGKRRAQSPRGERRHTVRDVCGHTGEVCRLTSQPEGVKGRRSGGTGRTTTHPQPDRHAFPRAEPGGGVGAGGGA